MGFCSAVTLAFATIFSLVAAALLAIAFSTDNWVTIKVDREELKSQLLQVITGSLASRAKHYEIVLITSSARL